MQVGDAHRHRVRGVDGRLGWQGEQAGHHEHDLLLLRPAVADNGRLDLGRRVGVGLDSESAEGGQLPELQREIIHNIFELEDLTAEELMTSRTHILAIEHNASRADIAAQIEASSTSRFPVFVDDLDLPRVEVRHPRFPAMPARLENVRLPVVLGILLAQARVSVAHDEVVPLAVG